VNAQRLDRVLTAYRIGDPNGAYPIFDATGSKLYPGRWNTTDTPMIYASQHYSTAMVEKLVHGGGHLPPNQHFIEITVPNGIAYEMVDPAHLPGWEEPACTVSKAFGAAWQGSKRSLLLIVPSVVARMEHNFLFNPEHPAFPQVTHGLHRPIWWDSRLFAPSDVSATSAPQAC
jgi:RES domain-containing protein